MRSWRTGSDGTGAASCLTGIVSSTNKQTALVERDSEVWRANGRWASGWSERQHFIIKPGCKSNKPSIGLSIRTSQAPQRPSPFILLKAEVAELSSTPPGGNCLSSWTPDYFRTSRHTIHKKKKHLRGPLLFVAFEVRTPSASFVSLLNKWK